jgi:hypothetical protein
LIGKVIRGKDVRRLLYYLFGPGKANEHADPHLVAGFGDPAGLEPERRPGGTRDARRLAGLLEQALAALRGPGYEKPVWHCAVRAADAAHAAADVLHVAARITRNETLRRAADAYDRAARAPYGRTPRRSPQGRALRTTAFLLPMAGRSGRDYGLRLCGLVASLADLTVAVAELRQAQQHAAQAAAARAAATRLRDVASRMPSSSILIPAEATRLGPPTAAPAAAAARIGARAMAQFGGSMRGSLAVPCGRRRGNGAGPSRASPKR